MAILAGSTEHALKLYREGHLADAETLLNVVLSDHSVDQQARLLRGVIRVKRGALEDASTDLEFALGQDRDSYDCLTWLALVRKNQRRYDEAVSMLERAVSIDGKKRDGLQHAWHVSSIHEECPTCYLRF